MSLKEREIKEVQKIVRNKFESKDNRDALYPNTNRATARLAIPNTMNDLRSLSA